MGNQIAETDRMLQRRVRVEARLLPDTCIIYPHERIVTDTGAFTDGLGEPIEYNGSTSIPCRLDISAHHRVQDLIEQETVISEFTLNVPFDVPLSNDYVIEVNNEQYEVIKLQDAEAWRVVKTALVTKVTVGQDA